MPSIQHIGHLSGDAWKHLVSYLVWIDIVRLVLTGNCQIILQLRQVLDMLNLVDNTVSTSLINMLPASKVNIGGPRLLALLDNAAFCGSLKSLHIKKASSWRIDAIKFGQLFPQLVDLDLDGVHKNFTIIGSLPHRLRRLSIANLEQYFTPFILKWLPKTIDDLCLWTNRGYFDSNEIRSYEGLSPDAIERGESTGLHFPPHLTRLQLASVWHHLWSARLPQSLTTFISDEVRPMSLCLPNVTYLQLAHHFQVETSNLPNLEMVCLPKGLEHDKTAIVSTVEYVDTPIPDVAKVLGFLCSKTREIQACSYEPHGDPWSIEHVQSLSRFGFLQTLSTNNRLIIDGQNVQLLPSTITRLTALIKFTLDDGLLGVLPNLQHLDLIEDSCLKYVPPTFTKKMVEAKKSRAKLVVSSASNYWPRLKTLQFDFCDSNWSCDSKLLAQQFCNLTVLKVDNANGKSCIDLLPVHLDTHPSLTELRGIITAERFLDYPFADRLVRLVKLTLVLTHLRKTDNALQTFVLPAFSPTLKTIKLKKPWGLSNPPSVKLDLSALPRHVEKITLNINFEAGAKFCAKLPQGLKKFLVDFPHGAHGSIARKHLKKHFKRDLLPKDIESFVVKLNGGKTQDWTQVNPQ